MTVVIDDEVRLAEEEEWYKIQSTIDLICHPIVGVHGNSNRHRILF